MIACLDATLRKFGGVPTYKLTDNKKSVTAAHVVNIPVRNAEMVEVAQHYGITIATCTTTTLKSRVESKPP